MKKGKIGLLVFLALLIALAVWLSLRFYPAWKSAEIMQEKMDLAHFTYEISVELEKEEVPADYTEIFASLSQITGVEEDALYSLTAKGSVWEDMIHAQIYCEGAAEPLIELYLSEEEDVLNGSRIYNAFREKLVGQNQLLGAMIPESADDIYMTFEQASQLFDLDLSGIGDFSIPFTDKEFSQKEYFVVLAALSRKKLEESDRYALEMERIQLSLEVPKAEVDSDIEVALGVQEPAEALAEASELLTKLGIELPVDSFKVLKKLSVTGASGNTKEPALPTNLISQEMIDALSNLGALMEQFSGK